MLSHIKSNLSSMYFAVALFALTVLGYVSPASAATTYDFSSSTAEAGALTSSLAGAVTTLFLTAFAVISGIALTMMGIRWIWTKFKQYTGIGKKI